MTERTSQLSSIRHTQDDPESIEGSVVSCQLSETRPILGYEPLFDIQAYQDLDIQNNLLPPQEFSRRKTQLDMRTKKNLETMLGERFKVEVSCVTYEIKNNQLISTQHDEPFIEIIKQGQTYRESNGSNDIERELAEVKGFEKVQEILTNLQSEGAKIVVISPRGKKSSVYQHNFFDIYERQNAIVIMTRYTSCATYEQFREVAESLDPFNELPQNPQDADFLQNPLITHQSIEDILALFPPDEEVITRKDLEKIIAVCSQIILNYVNNPRELTYNALLNFADALRIQRSNQRSDLVRGRTSIFSTFPDVKSAIGYYSSLPVRPVLTGCGIQTGSSSMVNGQWSMVNNFPYSVADFAFPGQINSSEDTSDFPCPRCGHIITYGADIKKCPGCDLEATCV